MGSTKVTLCAAAALAALLTTPAHAADGVSVTPSSPAPGGDVTLRVPDCTERTAVAVSAAFESDVRLTLTARDGVLTGSSRVRTSVSAGVYAVRVTCGDRARQGTLTVTEPRHRPTGPAAPATPVAPVDAGGGGTAGLAAAGAGDGARADGPGTPHTVTGLALGGLAALAVALRGLRGRRRGTR
ncbi:MULTISPECIES: hypothetical protein [unclassified Streptomyces]|uniref:hypothetical protein n=1 Tax=unclassified Streptomyces TaxID=2593676 RepID=UPI00136F9FC1|nr:MULTISPECIES: hypothetical protein [unclassified Streptomyces]MCW5252669.1 hypothetical protein [Streptomyces sp. SHP 1-2]MYU22160.1 hypothetical protein [Streptomyces sp. SID8352]